jgi:RNA polymerase sigma-32 factor
MNGQKSDFMGNNMLLACAQQGLLKAGSFEAYMRGLQNIPLLSTEEEQALALRFHESGDLKAVQSLIVAHLRYVAHVAQKYVGYGLAVADLMQEGTIGLMKAVKRFDPHMGIRLVSFAVHWIKAEIHEFVIRNWRIVRVATTKAQRKLFFNLRGSKKRLGWMGKEEVAMVAADLGVKPSEVLEMEQRLQSKEDFSIESLMQEDSDTVDNSAKQRLLSSDLLRAPNADPLQELEHSLSHQQQNNLHAVVASLSPRSQIIIRERWLSEEKTTFKELSERLDVSIERVRQLEQAALKEMGSSLKEAS